jgi:hypothetical protein
MGRYLLHCVGIRNCTVAGVDILKERKMPTLDELIEWARGYEMTPAEREAQRRSFAYGNCAIENPLVTRQMVDEVADRMNEK